MKRQLPMTVCPLIQGEDNADVLLDYCNRKLEPEMVAIFEKHMENCPACQAFASSQDAVWRALDAFEAMPISNDFDRKLWNRIEADQKAGWLSRLWRRAIGDGTQVWRPAMPIAAAVALLAVGLWVRPGFEGSVGGAVVAETVDAEQVETTLEDLEMLRQIAAVEASPAQQM